MNCTEATQYDKVVLYSEIYAGLLPCEFSIWGKNDEKIVSSLMIEEVRKALGLYETKLENTYVFAATTNRVEKFWENNLPNFNLSKSLNGILILLSNPMTKIQTGPLKLTFEKIRDLDIPALKLLENDARLFNLVFAALFGSLNVDGEVSSFSLSVRRFERLVYEVLAKTPGDKVSVLKIPCYCQDQFAKYSSIARSCHSTLRYAYKLDLKVSTQVLFFEPGSVFDLSICSQLTDAQKKLIREGLEAKNYTWKIDKPLFLIVCMSGIAEDVEKIVHNRLLKMGVPLDESMIDLSGCASTWLDSLRNIPQSRREFVKSLFLNDNHIYDDNIHDLLSEFKQFPKLEKINLSYNSLSLKGQEVLSNIFAVKDILCEL